ncbi:MAG: PD40 domain-containing protein, partial [Acidimicrobiia bacterium]|nr:PD40 domain-containing protein [Acidimicrobiia bacterium]
MGDHVSAARRRRTVLFLATTLVAVAGSTLGTTPAAASEHVAQQSAGASGPYFSARFTVQDDDFSFGQAPTFTAEGRVLSEENDARGVRQVYRSDVDGGHMTCLTCGRLAGPNGFAAERPGGGWILFASYGGQPQHYGGPGLGGYGGDLYVMRENGSEPTRLTAGSDPQGGAPFDVPGGIPYDNYHPYWSPDGRHVAWVRTEAYPLAQGGQRWEILLGDFVVPKVGPPHLADVRVVGPAFGVYETQQWAPDGSGFLFTAFGPRHSPFHASPPGWMHQELYFMRLYGEGASPAHPRVTHISDDLPLYEEQAAFTPDMRDVVFMTNREATDGSWYDAVVAAAQRTGFDAPLPGSAGTPQFLADFSDPNFRSDLAMVDLATHDVRVLTHFPDDVIPEFAWNRSRTQLIWSAAVVGTGRFRTQLGTFSGSGTGASPPSPRGSAPWLAGAPVDMGRVVADPPPATS